MKLTILLCSVSRWRPDSTWFRIFGNLMEPVIVTSSFYGVRCAKCRERACPCRQSTLRRVYPPRRPLRMPYNYHDVHDHRFHFFPKMLNYAESGRQRNILLSLIDYRCNNIIVRPFILKSTDETSVRYCLHLILYDVFLWNKRCQNFKLCDGLYILTFLTHHAANS